MQSAEKDFFPKDSSKLNMTFLNDLTPISLQGFSWRNYPFPVSLPGPSISQANSIKYPGSSEQKHCTMAICHVSASVGPLEWKTNISSPRFLWDRPTLRVLLTAKCATLLLMADPFNDRAHWCVSSFKCKEVFCHFEELPHLENLPANHIFPSFL